MKKLVKWIGIVVALLVLAVILFLLFGINPLVRMGVVRGGTHATGQTTTLNGANLSLMNGSLELTGLGI